MKARLYVGALLLWVTISPTGGAQAPAGAPAGSTGQCIDGSYTNAPSKKGACRGHQGVKTWFAASSSGTAPAKPAEAPASSAASPSTPAPAAPSAPQATKTTKSTTASSAPAPGGGPGLVWLNTSSNVYHCYGTKYYGTTKEGKYVTEAQAKAAGAHPDHGKACGQ